MVIILGVTWYRKALLFTLWTPLVGSGDATRAIFINNVALLKTSRKLEEQLTAKAIINFSF